MIETPVMYSREMPHSIEAEQSILGALLINNEVLWQICDVCAVHHFYDPLHQRLFEAIEEEISRYNRAATPVTLAPRFEGEASLGDITVPQYMARLVVNAISPAMAGEYALTLRDLWQRRELILAAEALAHNASDGAVDINGTIETVSAGLERITTDRAGETSSSAFDTVHHALEPDEGGLMTWGLPSLDRDTGGMRRGEFYIVAGRPSMGKSVFGTGVARAQAERGQGVMLFSLEMNRKVVGARMLSDALWRRGDTIPFSLILSNSVRGSDWPRIGDTAAHFKDMPLVIDTASSATVNDIKARLRRQRRNWDREGQSLDVAVIDYLGLIRPSATYSGNKVSETEEISQALKTLAKDLDIAVVCLVQLSRQVEGRDNKRPMLSDLRWSGAIEQDADVVVMLYREAYYLERIRETDPDKDIDRLEKLQRCKNTLELILAKQRNGPCRTIQVFADMGSSAIRDEIEQCYEEVRP